MKKEEVDKFFYISMNKIVHVFIYFIFSCATQYTV